MKTLPSPKASIKVSLVAMAVAGACSMIATATCAANTPSSAAVYTWDGNDILTGSDGVESAFTKNADGSVTFNLENITKIQNQQTSTAAILGGYYNGSSIPEQGFHLKNSTFKNNVAKSSQPANIGCASTILIVASGAAGTEEVHYIIEGSKFIENESDHHGGAVAAYHEVAFDVMGLLEITNSEFVGNKAELDGGAVSIGFNGNIADTLFEGNSAGEKGGGAIVSSANTLVMTDVVFTDNSSEGNGGALLLMSKSSPLADSDKGAVFNVQKNDLTYVGNKVTGDMAKGGFIYMGANNSATFNLAEGRTLTIGEAGVVDAKTDSFATEDDTARMVKEGAGTMMINSSMEDFNGAFDVAQGNVRIATLNMPGVLSADAEEGSAVVTIDKVAGDKLEATVNARRNGMVVIGSDEASVRSAMQKSGVTGDHGVIYVGQTLDMSGGSLVVGTGLDTVVDGSVVATNGGVLMVDQTAGTAEKPIFSNASVTIDADSTLTLVNASVGTINLADGALTVNGDITTDNPFIEGSIVDGQLVSALNAQDGLTSIASTGIQAMARRADFVMAQTIADRTAFDQERAQGVRLWVDVTGERYEADSLDNGGNFRADAGYAAFGGDLDASSDWVVGAAMQYGTGSLRSDVANIKNDITSYGLTGYASKKFGDWKVVGELAYLQSENEITSSQAALNVDVDAQVYSAGIRAQYELTAGSFAFIPSVGLRVSRLETDAFNVNTVRVDDQNQTLVQMPIALRITAADLNADGWSVAPNLKLAFVPTFGDKEIKMAGIEQTVIDTSPVQADFGILARKGNMTLNAGMLLGGGKDGTSSIGGKVGLSYAF
jgi:predicted outer membrane repeat protein